MLLILLLILPVNLYGDPQRFPVISRLHSSDIGFKQYQSDVESARRRIANISRTGNSSESIAEYLTVYVYTPTADDTLLTLAARCNIPYAGIATLNRIAHQSGLDPKKPLLLPSTPGLFIPEQPESDLEQLLASSRLAIPGGVVITIDKERFRFFPGADFNPTERVFFFHSGFRYPLRSYRLTSDFGPRINPITGDFRNHNGLDLAAPAGTEVYAVREGVVTEIGEDAVYGNYIIIRHSDGWASLYGHLSKIETALRRSVKSGTLIGRVGSTGQSTGPHLHFELRQNGKAQDPGKYLFKEGK
ncbi:MAG: M23 family metallopeptidase [Spirochaetaceae bacterium]|jgi:murein DD-endopeptidase MepM/ murein hydrolase activator NlpD|nr:M23 family metallopeptidase [Spirochaetaceae bacterium]